jgi:hypothetical protein
MNGAIQPLPQYAFMAWCSVKISTETTLIIIIIIIITTTTTTTIIVIMLSSINAT